MPPSFFAVCSVAAAAGAAAAATADEKVCNKKEIKHKNIKEEDEEEKRVCLYILFLCIKYILRPRRRKKERIQS